MLRRRELIITLAGLPAGALAGEAEVQRTVRAAIGVVAATASTSQSSGRLHAVTS